MIYALLLLLVPEPIFVPMPQFVPVPVFAPTTKFIQVVKVPGKYVRECVNGVCRERWVPPVMEGIEVFAKIAPEDEAYLKTNHHRLGPPSCLMAGCVTCPRKQILVDENDVPVAQKDREDEATAEACRMSPGRTRVFRLFRR